MKFGFFVFEISVKCEREDIVLAFKKQIFYTFALLFNVGYRNVCVGVCKNVIFRLRVQGEGKFLVVLTDKRTDGVCSFVENLLVAFLPERAGDIVDKKNRGERLPSFVYLM